MKWFRDDCSNSILNSQKKLCTLHILAPPLSKAIWSGHGEHSQANSALKWQKKVLLLSCNWNVEIREGSKKGKGEGESLNYNSKLLWQCLKTFPFADLLPKHFSCLHFEGQGATFPWWLTCLCFRLSQPSHCLPDRGNTTPREVGLLCAMFCWTCCYTVVVEESQTTLWGQC